jgi:hypothetical protein
MAIHNQCSTVPQQMFLDGPAQLSVVCPVKPIKDLRPYVIRYPPHVCPVVRFGVEYAHAELGEHSITPMENVDDELLLKVLQVYSGIKWG